jgi:hypothetical protein
VNLDDGFEGFDAHAVKDHVAQDAGVVHHAVELAEMIGGRLDDAACGDRFGDRLEIGDGCSAALLDLLDDFLGGRGTVTRTVGRAAGIVDHDLGAFGGAEQRNLPADAAARAGDDDGFAVK